MICAIKMFKSTLFGVDSKRTENMMEAEIVKSVCHDYIIKLIDVIDCQMGLILIFPMMKSNLFDDIYVNNSSPDLVKIAIMLLKGIQFMYSKHIMHRDLKPENILVDEFGCIKICDFGLATEYKENDFFMTICGTYRYMAPEMLLKFGYKNAVDIWVYHFSLFII